ncbi:EI24 domain-containing protein [Alphaproteobacteria bacterium KMM 3653]|uniref:EI24 domain-containing protein n=1 Tax=Harenicola maris TaxID=2841044 RepID=A0AAP2CQE3_9RHOB|nr:EI24 domain-containing protein [Harenicola maris]
MIFSDFAKAVAQVFDPRFLRVLLIGVGLTIALLVGIYFLFQWGIMWLLPENLTIFGYEITWLDNILGWASVGVTLLLSMFLMVPVASAFTGLFLDDIARAVEERHYAGLPPVPRLPWGEVIADTLAFLGLLLLANLGMLLIYILAFPIAPLLFIAVNGLLLGREYFQMVAMRRLGRSGANRARSRHFLNVWWAGILMTVPLSIPILNLFVPILACATFTHQFHRLEPQRQERTPARTG